MTGTLLVAGIAAQAALWRAAARGRTPFWPTVAATNAVLGGLALAVASVTWCGDVACASSLSLGAASGVLLYAATRVVVEVATTRMPALAASVSGVYRWSEEIAPVAAWALTILAVVPGEELFWRGLVLPELQRATSPVAGAVLAWAGAVGVAATWANLPFLLAAIVGGAAWTALGVWSGGVLAPLASHLVWTSLMLAWPPAAAHVKVRS